MGPAQQRKILCQILQLVIHQRKERKLDPMIPLSDEVFLIFWVKYPVAYYTDSMIQISYGIFLDILALVILDKTIFLM